MKKVRISLVIFFTFLNTSFTYALYEIKGKVIDAATKAPLSGAIVHIPKLKIVTKTNINGEFTFINIPNKDFYISASYLGYKTSHEFYNPIENPNTILFSLELSSKITKVSSIYYNHSPVEATSIQLPPYIPIIGTNFIDVIAKVIPRVSQITTGNAISKPSIRGLGHNRILTIVDGVREEVQQWGDDHGVEIDRYAVEQVNIINGTGTQLYGSDALGGVINIDNDSPYTENLNGQFLTNYNTNGGLIESSLRFDGNSDGFFVYHAQASYKNAYGFSNGNNKVIPNSGFNEANLNGMMGLNKSWGYARLNLSKFSTNIGLVKEGPNDKGNFIDDNGNLITNSDARKRHQDLPFQNINHYRAVLNSNLLLPGGQLNSTLAFQKNIRKEFGENMDPGLHLNLNSYTYDLKYSFAKNQTWEPAIGIQGMYQTNANNSDEFLIPDYVSNNIGTFFHLKRNFKNGSVDGIIRYDYKKINGKNLIVNDKQIFAAFNNKYSNISGSLGLKLELVKNLTLKGNATNGFRAPNIAEISANGKHEGTFRYEIGNSNLKQETSLQFDVDLAYILEMPSLYNQRKISLNLRAYNYRIYNYIYSGNFNNEITPYVAKDGSNTNLSLYRFVQTDANFLGGEADIYFYLSRNLYFENTFAYVKGTNLLSKSPLPFIPATSLNNELRLEPRVKGVGKGFIKIGLNNVFKQNRFDNFESKTNGYTLINAGIGVSIKTKTSKNTTDIWIIGQNLANKLYFDHLSRYKLINVYNPGININFGIRLPLL